MSYKHNIIKERFDITVSSPNEVFKGDFELDKNAKIVYGIALTTDREDLLFHRGSQKIQLNDSELFPENFESKLLMTGLNVSPNSRMIKVGNVKSGNGKLEVWYRDTDGGSARFTPYRVTIYVFSYADEQCAEKEGRR